MSSVTLENAAFSDVVKKVASVAAAKGEAFDKASGIILENDTNAGFRIRATNLELFYTEWMDPLEIEGNFCWRVSSRFLSAIAANLPIGSDKRVKLTEDGTFIRLKSGGIASGLPRMKEDLYPSWGMFNPDGMTSISGFAEAVAAVEWASSNDNNPPLSGVHFNGESVIASDRHKLALYPCKVDLPDGPITIPGGVMSQLVKTNTGSGETLVGWEGLRGRLLVMPNEHSQIEMVTFGVEFPNVAPLFERNVGESSFRIGKSELLQLLQRVEALSNIDNRVPKLTVWVGKNMVAAQATLENHDGAMLGDRIECLGIDHPLRTFSFTPRNLIGAISNAPGNEVEITYHKDNETGFWFVASDGGYQAIVIPRKRGQGEQ